MDGSESIVSILFGREGWDNQYGEISNFKEHLHLKEGSVAEEKVEFGWVLRCSDHKTPLQHRVINLFRHIAHDPRFCFHYLVQFWAVEVEGQNRTFLSTARQPFSVGNLAQGLAQYRKLCADHVLCVAGKEQEQEPVGGVGRAYRSGYPESTPDLRLYTRDEFPTRDEAARSYLRGYLALPLYELYSDECCGVLELLSGSTIGAYQLSSLDQGMQIAGLRSTHTNFIPISKCRNSMPEKYKQQQGENEIGEALRLAMATVPRLHFAQVWIPCKQCANSICMERACFIDVDATDFNSCRNVDEDMFVYLQACEFHNLQLLDPNHRLSRQNLCDLGISENPLVHHAKKARLSRRFAVFLQRVGGSKGEERCVIELFLQPSSREGDAQPLRSVLGILDAMLDNFELLVREHLPEEPAAQPRQLVDMLITDMESFSETSGFTEYVDTLNSYECCLRPSASSEDGVQGWVFRMAKTENDGEGVLVRGRVENLMKNVITDEVWGEYWIVQFWAPKMAGGRCFLQALDQPYAVGCLAKGLASLRKKCTGQRYFVDEEAREDEVGPPGRVFRIGIHETTPDLSLYSTKEFPIKAYAVNCCLQQYSALPVFNNEHRDRCVGVLELIGVPISSLKLIKSVLRAATLCSTHIDFSPIFPENENTAHISSGREQALSEMMEALLQMANIPQLHMAKVWVPNSETCSSLDCTNARCMELALSTADFLTWEYMSKNQVHWIHVKPGKGMIGTVLDSESKSCFCRNLYEFSIADQHLAHYQRKERLDACFAICLQSSHTGGDFPYVIEFFLYQTHEYLVSFLNFLIPVMNQLLKSFEYASGKRLAEEMVVDVIEFSPGDNTTLTFCEQGQPQYPFPIKFKSVSYSHNHSQEGEDDEPMPCVSGVMQIEESKSSAHPKETKKAKGKTGSHLNFEDLEPHFGRKLEDVAGVLGVGRSTIKRVCRENGIKRWPSNTKNPSLLERERGWNSQKVKGNIIVEEEVTMKVTYKEDTIKFKLRLSLGVTKVMEEVASGLNLKMSTIKLKYLDEDNEEILLARDVDFQHCPRITTASGVTCIKLFVQLISE